MIQQCLVSSATGRWILVATLLATGAAFLMGTAVIVANQEKKSFLRKKIELNAPQIVSNYTVPLPVKGLTTTEEVLRIAKLGSPSWTRTNNLAVNSRPLYH